MNALPPPMPDRDGEHLRLLAIFHYVMGGIIALFSCIPIVHVALGLMMIFNPESFAGNDGKQGEIPPFMGYLFAVMGLFFVLGGWTMAVCTLASGRMITRRKRRVFSIVIAAVLCAFAPLGTVLGVFTIIILTRDSVVRLYESAQPA